MKNFITLLSGIVIIFSIYSCNRRSGNIDSDESELSGSETVNTDTVELTNEQVKTAGIELPLTVPLSYNPITRLQ